MTKPKCEHRHIQPDMANQWKCVDCGSVFIILDSECRHAIASRLTLCAAKGTYDCVCGVYDVGWEVAEHTKRLLARIEELEKRVPSGKEETE